MAQIPVLTKLQLEDVPKEQREWMSKLIPPLNDFISETVAALSRDLTFTQNIAAQIKELSVSPAGIEFEVDGDLTTGSTYVENISTVDILPGQAVSGTGIDANTYVVLVFKTAIVLSQPATSTSTETLTFVGHNAVPLKFACTLKTRPVFVRVGSAMEISSSPAPITTPIEVLDWEFTQAREIQINAISGLLPGQKYRLTFIAF